MAGNCSFEYGERRSLRIYLGNAEAVLILVFHF